MRWTLFSCVLCWYVFVHWQRTFRWSRLKGSLLFFSFPSKGMALYFVLRKFFSRPLMLRPLLYSLFASSLLSQRMMTEQPENYQRMLQNLIVKAQQVKTRSHAATNTEISFAWVMNTWTNILLCFCKLEQQRKAIREPLPPDVWHT